MFRYIIYGRTENEENDILRIAGIDDLDDALIIMQYITNREYFIGNDEVKTFGILDTTTNEPVKLN